MNVLAKHLLVVALRRRDYDRPQSKRLILLNYTKGQIEAQVKSVPCANLLFFGENWIEIEMQLMCEPMAPKAPSYLTPAELARRARAITVMLLPCACLPSDGR